MQELSTWYKRTLRDERRNPDYYGRKEAGACHHRPDAEQNPLPLFLLDIGGKDVLDIILRIQSRGCPLAYLCCDRIFESLDSKNGDRWNLLKKAISATVQD